MSSYGSRKQIYGTSGKSGSSHKEVRISGADKSGRDSKFEGYSELSRGNDKRMKKDRKSIDNRSKDDLEVEMISNLQRQIGTLELEIKMLKEREVDQKNKASGYETLLRDKIPLNEHFLALKNKFNNDQDGMKKTAKTQEEDNFRLIKQNNHLDHEIKISKHEHKKFNKEYLREQDKSKLDIAKLEDQLYIQTHTKTILEQEKKVIEHQLLTMKGVNSADDRTIKQAKTFNKKEDEIKEKQILLDQLILDVEKQQKQIIEALIFADKETRRLEDKDLIKKQQKETMQKIAEANQCDIAFKQNESKIKDLEVQQEMTNTTIEETLAEKYIVDKENIELEIKMRGRTDEEQKAKLYDMEIQYVNSLKLNIEFQKQDSEITMSKLNVEEDRGRKKLDETITQERKLEDIDYNLSNQKYVQNKNRHLLVDLRQRLSQLDAKKENLTVEVKDLKEGNGKVLKANDDLLKDNEKLEKEIKIVVKRIKINNMLKEIDAEELMLQAEQNKQTNMTLLNLVNKWENIQKGEKK